MYQHFQTKPMSFDRNEVLKNAIKIYVPKWILKYFQAKNGYFYMFNYWISIEFTTE
jgi:hypothetical protein